MSQPIDTEWLGGLLLRIWLKAGLDMELRVPVEIALDQLRPNWRSELDSRGNHIF